MDKPSPPAPPPETEDSPCISLEAGADGAMIEAAMNMESRELMVREPGVGRTSEADTSTASLLKRLRDEAASVKGSPWEDLRGPRELPPDALARLRGEGLWVEVLELGL